MLHGSCLCGAIQYDLDITDDKAKKTSACHCRPCRKITGATTSLNLTVPASSFTLKSGNLKEVRTKHVDEGFEFSILFCPDCGSPIYAVPPTNLVPNAAPTESVLVIQVGTLDDMGPLDATPVQEINVLHRLGWVGKVEGAAQKRTYVE